MSVTILAADPFLERYSDEITGVVTLVIAFALAAAVDRALRGRARGLAARMSGGELSPVVDTRLRFMRRVIEAVIIVIGLSLAISQFTALDRLASTVLAS
ncbi:MAG: small conductance mechanosensitive channel, partial [Solirubrobacteraceae bacterium]|nr:small conductance mechanosensitive channel [Solirubrobacteraceae bacterium]